MTRRAFGRYVAERVLGEGGYGRVWLARDPVLARDVAVKVPRGDWWGEDAVIEEARALARLAHPSIVQVLDAGRDAEGRAFLVMELVEGEDLESLLSRGVRLEPADALRLLAGPADALDHAHAAGVLHRDFKPGNVLVLRGRPGAPPSAKVLDFGLAALAARHARAPAPLGDPRHAAPEAWRGEADPSSDVFSLASVFFRMVAGAPATPGRDPREWIAAAGLPGRRRLAELRPDLPAELDAALAGALSPRRHERPAGARALLRALADGLARRAERQAVVGEARARIEAREKREPRACPDCGRKLSPRAEACPFCVPG